jgi:hypothetical protein
MGIILGNDQKRYNFVGSEWKEQQAPVRGNEVDFDVNAEGQATGIYLDFMTAPTSTTQIKTSAPSQLLLIAIQMIQQKQPPTTLKVSLQTINKRF